MNWLSKKAIDARRNEMLIRCAEDAAVARPEPGKDYAWVMEYAQQRQRWASEAVAATEAKAVTVLKLATGSAAAIWAVLTFALSQHLAIGPTAAALAYVAIAALIAAISLALFALRPIDRLAPRSAGLAFDLVKDAGDSDPRGWFAQGCVAVTNWDLVVAAHKGTTVRWAHRAAGIGILLISLAALVVAHRIVG